MTKRAATSYSATLDLSSLSSRTHWSILSSHRHACNLLAADGTLVALVDEAHGNGPFHIVVPHARFEIAYPAADAEWHDQLLHLADLRIDLTFAHAWDPTLPTLPTALAPGALSLYESAIQTQSAFYLGTAAFIHRAQRGVAALRMGVLHGHDDAITQGVLLLAGLGPGLTPTGDDFLVGFMAALHSGAIAAPIADWRILPWKIAQMAKPSTTRLSAAWLVHAGNGHFGEQWHQLITALNDRERTAIDQAVQRILTTGATSGADALYGFLSALAMDESATGSPA